MSDGGGGGTFGGGTVFRGSLGGGGDGLLFGDDGDGGLPSDCERKLCSGLLAKGREHLTEDSIGGEGGRKRENHLHGVHRVSIEGAGEAGDAHGGRLQVNRGLSGEGSGDGGASVKHVGRWCRVTVDSGG